MWLLTMVTDMLRMTRTRRGRRLRTAGLPLDRLALHIPTLHPEVAGRTLCLAPNEPVKVYERDRLAINSALFCQSPLRQVNEANEALNIRSTDWAAITLNDLDVFEGRSLSEFLIEPSRGAGNPTSVVCFATANPAGFQIVDRAIVDRMLPGRGLRTPHAATNGTADARQQHRHANRSTRPDHASEQK